METPIYGFCPIEYGFGYILLRSPYIPYSIDLRGTIGKGLKGIGFRFSWFMIYFLVVGRKQENMLSSGYIGIVNSSALLASSKFIVQGLPGRTDFVSFWAGRFL